MLHVSKGNLMSQHKPPVTKSPTEQEVQDANQSVSLILQLLPLNQRRVIQPHVVIIEKVLGSLAEAPTNDKRGSHWAEKRKAKALESAPATDPRLTKPRY